jgi:integrase
VVLRDRPISVITAPEVLVALREVEGKGRLETAKRLRAVIGEVFRYAVATARAISDPTFALRGALTAPVVKHRAAITDPKELGALLRAIDGFQGNLPPMRR